jgi:hypothetical protein
VSDPSEDFAAMFEASLKPKRFERGQTIEGTIIAIRAEASLFHSCMYRRLHALASASQTVGARIQRACQVACVAAEEPR